MHSCRIQKQGTVALSSTEAEYMALFKATKEAVWIKKFLWELGEIATQKAIKMLEDNQKSTSTAKNPEFHYKTKHIDVRFHFVRKKVESGEVALEYCPTRQMLADLMMKLNSAAQFDYL